MNGCKMKKLKFVIVIAVLLVTSGCTGNMTGKDRTTQTESELNTQSEEASEENAEATRNRLKGLVLNEYPDLEITAAVLERKAILPGAVFPVNITVKNNGDRSIAYVRGSGSYEVPEALVIDAAGLQPILPVSHLGIATLDLRTEYLEPGEQLEYIWYVRAIEANDNFDQYTHDLYTEEQSYIGDLSWEELKDTFPDLIAAAPASYDIYVYFTYYILDTESENLFSETTGYAESIFSVSVTE